MSTALDEHTDSGTPDPGRIPRLVRVLAVLAALASLVALWSGERTRADHDLQLSVEAVARPGDMLAVRAIVFEHVDDPHGPELAVMPVRLRLLDAHARVLAETTLIPEPATQSMEGRIRVPSTLRGAALLLASVRLADGSTLECERPLQVLEDAPLLVPQPRSAGPLQTLAIASVRSTNPEAAAPVPFLPRILGGACPPEQRCTILVWVGEPASAISVREDAQVSVVARPVPEGETSGLAALEIIPHGLEVQVTLEARRAGRMIAERTMRLPVALGEVGVFVRMTLLEPHQPLELALTLPPGRENAIVDLFEAGRWMASESVPQAAAADLKLPVELVPAGVLTRVQGRVDRFSSEGAGTRLVYRRAPGEAPKQAMEKLFRLVQQVSPSAETAAWNAALPEFLGTDLQRGAAFLVAPLELLRVPLPDAHSARPQRLAKLERKRAFLHFGVASVLVLAAILVASSLMQRGLSAAREARAILEEARQPGDVASTDSRWGVVLLVLAVALAFLAGALLIVAKPLWF